MVWEKMNNIFVVLLVVVDLMIGLMIILLYICYGVVFELLWFVKFEGFFWIVIILVMMYSLSVVSIDWLIFVIYLLCYY